MSLSEFKRWLEANGAARGMAEEEVEALFKSVDFDQSGTVQQYGTVWLSYSRSELCQMMSFDVFLAVSRTHCHFVAKVSVDAWLLFPVVLFFCF